jgi:hypothetical protein
MSRRIREKTGLLLAVGSVAGLEAHGQIKVTWANLHPAPAWYSYANAAGETQQAGQYFYNGTAYHAALWSGTAGSMVDLHPAAAAMSWVDAAATGQQVGYASIAGQSRAAFWAGTAASFVDLTPSWASSAEALGVGYAQQVGWCNLTNPSSGVHAVLWSGSANSCVDLHPTGWRSSQAYATTGSSQVGGVTKYGSGNEYAALWAGSVASFVELGPESCNGITVIWSRAVAAGGTNQAGFYQLYSDLIIKAAMWSGSSQSFVNLHPSGATTSTALATTDTLQAGTANINGQVCLGVWRGTAQSFVNLGAINCGLGTGLTNLEVRGISIQGNTLYLAGDVSSQAVVVKAVLLPPSLRLANLQSQGSTQIVSLTWTNNGVSSVLESGDTPVSGWKTAGGVRTTNANSYAAIVTNIASVQFFRLRAN